MSTLRISRRACQFAVALGVPALAWLNAQGWERLSGNFLSFSLLEFPLADPLAALQVCLSSMTAPWRMVLGGGVALALAAVLGTVFCSWVCPFGLLSELVRKAVRKPAAMGRPGWRRKWALGGAALALIALAGLPPMLNQLSLPAWYSRVFQTWFNQQELAPGLLLLAGVLAAEAFAGRRFWCRYVCPQSLLLNLVHRFSPFGLRVRFEASRCSCVRGDDHCARACPLNLNPRLAGHGLEWECSTCGECTEACSHRGKALTLGFGPAPKK